MKNESVGVPCQMQRETDCQNDQLGDQRNAGWTAGMKGVVGRVNLKDGGTLEMEIHREEIKQRFEIETPKHTLDQTLKCHRPLVCEFVSPTVSPNLLCVTTHEANAIEMPSCLDLRGYWFKKTGWTVESCFQLVSFPIRGTLQRGEGSNRVVSLDLNEFFHQPRGSCNSQLGDNYWQTQTLVELRPNI